MANFKSCIFHVKKNLILKIRAGYKDIKDKAMKWIFDVSKEKARKRLNELKKIWTIDI